MASFDANATYPPFGPAMAGTSGVNRFQGAFPDPYLDYASTQMPRSIYDVLRWCEFVWITTGTYRMAAQRVVRYFLTEIELLDVGDSEKKKYQDFLEDEVNMMEVLATAGDNYMCYGQDFMSISVPFRRNLRCPKCGLERPIGKCEWGFDQYEFTSKCPKCHYQGKFERVDRRSVESDPVKVVHWSPYEMRIQYFAITGETTYFWEIPGYFKNFIKTGNKFYIEHTPWEIIEAIKENKLFRFDKDVIFHLRDEPIAGIRNFGWGLPLIMSNFKLAWYIQVLRRYNEAIALDYIIPFRVMVPIPGTSREADPVLHINMNQFYSRVMNLYKQHRKDPTMIHALPFPIDIKSIGGDGKNLAPWELIDKATDEFLNAQGVPAEMYRGNLQVNVAPVSIRLFERTWVHLVGGLNTFLRWSLKRVADMRNWEKVKARLQPVMMADSIEDRQIRIQLAQAQQISAQTAYGPFGINIRDEIKKQIEEEKYRQEKMQEFQEDMAQKQQLESSMQAGAMGQMPFAGPGQAGQPGMPPGGGMAVGGIGPGGPPPMGGMPIGGNAAAGGITPQDMQSQAEQMAYQFLAMPAELRRSELLKLKKSNETLHAIVISRMNNARQQAQTQGGFQMLQQQVAGGGQM